MTQTQHNRPDAQTITMNRRRALQLGAAAGGAAMIGARASTTSLAEEEDLYPGGGDCYEETSWTSCPGYSAFSWTTQRVSSLISDDPPDGLTESALRERIHLTGEKRSSYNHIRYTATDNVLEYIREPAYSDAKIAAFEAINNEKTQVEVEEAAKEAIRDHYSVVLENYINAFNEMALEAEYLGNSVDEHPDFSRPGVVMNENQWDMTGTLTSSGCDLVDVFTRAKDYELPNGEMTTIQRSGVETHTYNDNSDYYDEHIIGLFEFDTETTNTNQDSADPEYHAIRFDPFPDDIETDLQNYAFYGFHTVTEDGTEFAGWHGRAAEILHQMDEVISEVVLWVENVYGEVQSGDIDPTDILGPREWSEMMAEDENHPMAVSDLIALNVPVDHTQSTVELGDGQKLSGILAATADGQTLTPGESYNPENLDGEVIVSAEPDAAMVDLDLEEPAAWDDDKGVDGGIIHITRNLSEMDWLPPQPTVYVETTEGETATFAVNELEETTNAEDQTVWEIDVSDQLENAIAGIEDVNIYAGDDHNGERTNIPLDEEFTVTEYDGDGDVDFERNRDPQTADNYITKDEWGNLEERMENEVSQYEDSSGTIVGGGGGISWPSLPGIGELPSMVWYGILALFGITALNAASG